MKPRIPALAALLAVLLSAPFLAQEANGGTQRGDRTARLPVIDADSLELSYYTPKEAYANELLHVVDRLYGRTFLVRTEAEDSPHMVGNLSIFRDMLILYDTKAQVERITAALIDLEAAHGAATGRSAAARDAAVVLVTCEYLPRFVPLATLRDAVRSFQRQLVIPQEDGTEARANNIDVIEQPPALLIRDTQANADQILFRLRAVDQPLPQVMVTAYLLSPEGTWEHPLPAEVPEELAGNLARLTPYDSFAMLAMSSIRSNVSAGKEARLTLEGYEGAGGEFTLQLSDLGYDAASRSLTVGSASLERLPLSQGFNVLQTSFTAFEGEYAVIGLTGDQPLLLALTFRALPGPKLSAPSGGGGDQARRSKL